MIGKPQNPHSRIAGIALVVAAALVAGHWSLETLAELHGGLQPEFRHTLAVFVLLLLIRWVVAGHHRTLKEPRHAAVKD